MSISVGSLMRPTGYCSGAREDFVGCLHVVDLRPFGALRRTSRRTRQEIAHSQDVVGRESEHEHPAHSGAPPVSCLPHQPDGLQPAEDLLDALALLLTQVVAR